MSNKAKLALSLAMLALAAALFIPTLIDSTQQKTQSTVELEQDSQFNLTQRLRIEATDIDNQNSYTNVTLTNTQTLEKKEANVSEGENVTFELSGENILVTVERIDDKSDGNVSVNRVEYDPKFGWQDESKGFIEHFDIILTILALVAAMGATKKVMA